MSNCKLKTFTDSIRNTWVSIQKEPVKRTDS